MTQQQRNGPDQEKAEREGYNLALQFAKDGLETLIAVTDILERTIVSAESWIDTLYKKKEDNAGSPQSTTESAYSSHTTTKSWGANFVSTSATRLLATMMAATSMAG